MRKLAIFAALFGILTLAACGGQTPAATPTIDPIADVGPTPDANPDQQTSFAADISGEPLGSESPLEFTALGQFACQPPTTTQSGGSTIDIPGSITISGLNNQERLVTIRLPFDIVPGEYPIDPGGGLNAVTADIVLDPSDPNAVYRATSGTVTLEALPLVQGDRVAGSFNFSAPQAADTEGETSLSATGSFDFVADNTSILCNRPDRGNE